MKQKTSGFYEILLAVIIVLLLLLPQLIGTVSVFDETEGLDENGCPVTSMTLEDLEAPGTRFGSLTIHEWETEILKRFPEGKVHFYNSLSNSYAALAAGEVDAAMGFIDERQTLAASNPHLAFIEEPYAVVDFGFATQKSEKGKILCRELNQYLAGLKKSGEYDALRKKWEDPGRKGDVMGEYQFSGEKGTVRVVTGGLWTPMTYYQGKKLTGEFIEIINGFCAAEGYIPKYETVDFSAELTGLASGTYDICADSVTSSEERLESIYVTDPLMADEYYMIVTHEMHFARDVSNRVFFMDEGIIYEEGTPEEIFNAPKKDKTRQFINRLQVLEMLIGKTGFDTAEQFARIEQFGSRHMISRRIVNRMLTVVEELCIQTILPMLDRDREIRLVFEYSDEDGGSVDMEVMYDGRDQNPLETGDALCMALTRHACQTLNWEYQDGVCRIKGRLVYSS